MSKILIFLFLMKIKQLKTEKLSHLAQTRIKL